MNFVLMLFCIIKWSYTVPLNTRNIFAYNLNEKSGKELIFLHEGKKLSIFETKEKGIVPLHEGVVLWEKGNVIDFGDICPEFEGDEIVILSNDEVRVFRLDGRKIVFVKSIKVDYSSLYPLNPFLRKGSFIYDVYGDGNKKVLFLYPEKAIITDGEKILQTIPIIGEASISTTEDKASIFERPGKFSLLTTYISPLIFFKDVNGDKENDLIEYSHDSLYIFFQKNKKFPNSPDISFDLTFLKEKEELGVLPPQIFIEDVNNDKKADLLVLRSGKGFVFGSKGIVYLFLNNGSIFSKVPSQVIIVESSYPDVELMDINRDNKMDIVINSSGQNIWSLLKMIIMKKLDFTYSFYIFKEKAWTEAPVFSRNFSVSLNVSEPEKGESIEFSYDWDNDGFYDIVFFKKDEILIYRGKGEKGFEKSPSIAFKIETSNNYIIDDLNGDGKIDILFWKNLKKKTEVWGFFQ